MTSLLEFGFKSSIEPTRSPQARERLIRAAKRLRSSSGYIPNVHKDESPIHFWASLPRGLDMFDARRHVQLWEQLGIKPTSIAVKYYLPLSSRRQNFARDCHFVCLDGENGLPTFSVIREQTYVLFWSYDIEQITTPGFIADFSDVATLFVKRLLDQTGVWTSHQLVLKEMGNAAQTVYRS